MPAPLLKTMNNLKTHRSLNLYSLPLLCFLAGSLSSLSMAPNQIWGVLMVGLATLYVSVNSAKTSKSAMLCGWAFGFGYFIFGLSWIGNALLVEGNPYKWAWPLAVAALPFGLAFFSAFAAYLTRIFFNLRTASGLLGFTAIFSSLEWVRGHIFTGFPWNLYGYAWGDVLAIAQISAIGNIYHLSALTIFWSAALGFAALILTDKIPADKTQGGPYNAAMRTSAYSPNQSSKQVIILSCAALTLALCYSWGAWRLTVTPTTYQDNVQIRLVQPNIEQSEKWKREKMAQHFFKHIRMSYPQASDDEETTTYIIWPETATSDNFLRDKTSMNILRQALRSYPGESILLTGALQRRDGQYFNSLLSINKNAEITGTYDKHHLVPFGEYIPLQKWIPLSPVSNFSGVQRGERGTVLNTQLTTKISTQNSLSFLPLICYEIIFPHLKTPHSSPGLAAPDFIVNVTNDAWYGFSAGPHQHLLHAKFRAIESGLPVIRVANTGISAVFDPLGRRLTSTALFEDSIKTSPLPQPSKIIAKAQHFENITFLIMVMCALTTAILLKRNTKL